MTATSNFHLLPSLGQLDEDNSSDDMDFAQNFIPPSFYGNKSSRIKRPASASGSSGGRTVSPVHDDVIHRPTSHTIKARRRSSKFSSNHQGLPQLSLSFDHQDWDDIVMLNDCLHKYNGDEKAIDDVGGALEDSIMMGTVSSTSILLDSVVSASSEDGSEKTLLPSIDEFLVDDSDDDLVFSKPKTASTKTGKGTAKETNTAPASKNGTILTANPKQQQPTSDNKTKSKPKRRKAPLVITKNYPCPDNYYRHMTRLMRCMTKTRQTRHSLCTNNTARRNNISAVLYHINYSTRQMEEARLHPRYFQPETAVPETVESGSVPAVETA